MKTFARYTDSFYSSAHCLSRWLYGWSNVWSKNSCNSSYLPALALCKLPICISLYTQCPVIANTLQIWFQFRQCFGFKDFSTASPISARITYSFQRYWTQSSVSGNSRVLSNSMIFLLMMFLSLSQLFPLNTICQDYTCLDIFKFIIWSNTIGLKIK